MKKPIKLTKDSFDLDNITMYEKNDSDTPTGYQVLGVYFPEDATHEEIKNKVQQILGDYEKARSWDDLFKLGYFDTNNEGKIVIALEVAKQNQKLRELIEKRIEDIDNLFDGLHYEGTMASSYDQELLTVKIELQKLLEENKK